MGLVEPIRQALAPYSEQIASAFIFGSIARGTEDSGSDVDLMIVSDALDHATVYDALAPAERFLARSVDPTLLTTEEWERRLATDDSFVARLSAGPRLAVLGESEDV